MTRFLTAIFMFVALSGMAVTGASVAGPAHDVPAINNVSNDADAQAICRTTCRMIPEEWNGGWRPATPGNTGTCSCGDRPRRPGWGFSPANGASSARAMGESACSAPPSQNGSCSSCSISCSGDQHASCSQGQEWPGGSPTCMRDAKCECK